MAEVEGAARARTIPIPSEPTLKKIALLLRMDEEVRAGHRSADTAAKDSLLDDPAVAGWVSAMYYGGFITNDRFTRKVK